MPETRPAAVRYAASARRDVSAPAGNSQMWHNPAAPYRARNYISARTIGALTPKVTKTAFQKFGFATAQLVGDWRAIVGDRLAATTAPDKLRWPKRPGEVDGDGSAVGPRGGATLVIRVEPAVALDVQYKATMIVERINAYFGYRAVSDLRIVQGHIARQGELAAAAPRPTPGKMRKSTALPLDGITDEGLKAALQRMQAGLQARQG